MPAPPSPPYPKLETGTRKGSPCGSNWDSSVVVTGVIPGTGGQGNDLQIELPPVATRAILKNIGSDRQTQIDLRTVLEDKIDALREELADNSGEGGKRRMLTSKEEKSVRWLLDHAEAELDAANALWEKWEDKDFPLSRGDNAGDYHPACLNKPGKTVTIKTQGRPIKIKCPSSKQLKQRLEDRYAIGQRFDWALMHIRCAEWGMNRLLLYKRALADLKEIPFPEKVPVPPEGGPATPFTGPGQFKPPTIEPDYCKELGIGCPVGEEPPVFEGVTGTCPSDFCPEPEGLPDPGEMDDGLPTGEEPEKPKPKKKTYSAGAVATAGVVGAAAVFGLYQLLKPR